MKLKNKIKYLGKLLKDHRLQNNYYQCCGYISNDFKIKYNDKIDPVNNFLIKKTEGNCNLKRITNIEIDNFF